jgi:kanamycin kinase
VLAAEPDEEVALPASLERFVAGRPTRAVWRNELGGLTFEVGTRPQHFYAKWTPASSNIDLNAEAARIDWASPFVTVPGVIGLGGDADGAWMLTTPIEGENAVTAHWKASPGTAVASIARGLRSLHDELPAADCPFSWSVEHRLADVGDGSIDVAGLLRDAPALDRLVVCHGDACSPNTILRDNGDWSGHVDLGALGVADRWADIAVATWSLEWNYGRGWDELFLDSYGIDPDPERTQYYRRVWEITP